MTLGLRWRDEAEALCLAVAPELSRRPPYVVMRGELGADLQTGRALWGCTWPLQDLALRPELEAAGRWQGRRPAILIDLRAIVHEFRGCPYRFQKRRAVWATFRGVVLHELAHILDADADPGGDAEPDDGQVDRGRLNMVAELSGSCTPGNGPGARIPWMYHEWGFIRTALHLAHRTTARGAPVLSAEILDAAGYGLSSTSRYAAALGDEPRRLADADFATIRATTPPPAFAELWRADLARWAKTARVDELERALARRGRRLFVPTWGSIMQELLTELEARKLEREKAFWQLARRIAGGAKPTAADVERTLAGADKGPDELREAIALCAERARLAADVANDAAIEKERGQLAERIATANAAFAQAEQKHEETVGALHSRITQIDETLRASAVARQRLIATCPDSALQAEYAAALARLAGLRNRAFDLRQKAELVRTARDELKEAALYEVGEKANYWRARAQQHQREGEQAAAELADVEKEITRAEREEKAIHARMLRP